MFWGVSTVNKKKPRKQRNRMGMEEMNKVLSDLASGNSLDSVISETVHQDTPLNVL